MPTQLSTQVLFQMRADLASLATQAGEAIMAQRGVGTIQDTNDHRGHESSTIDEFARQTVQSLLDKYLPGFDGTVYFELNPYSKQNIGNGAAGNHLVLIIDEVEGTTNTKRALASKQFNFRPQALVSIAVSSSKKLTGLSVGAVYSLDRQMSFSAVKLGDSFVSFCGDEIIDPRKVIATYGDSRPRVIVAGYSNSHRLNKGKLEQAIWSVAKVYEGCRASGSDLINVVANQYDAYIDARSLWSRKVGGVEMEAMLQVYDVAGSVPFAVGCGMLVTDVFGEPWTGYSLEDTIPLVVARPYIHQKIIEAIAPLVSEWKPK